MDYSQFSTDDLKAMQAGDISKVSSAALKALQAEAGAPKQSAPKSFMDKVGDVASKVWETDKAGVRDLAAGATQHAANIGTALLYPVDKLTDMVMGDRDPTLSGLITGKQPMSRHDERKASINGFIDNTGADRNALMFKGGGLATDLAATGGVGGLLKKGAIAAAPTLTATATGAKVVNAIGSAGFSTGAPAAATLAGRAADLGIRAAGGAITNGVSTAIVDPEHTLRGAVAGGVLPVAVAGAGKVAGYAGRTLKSLVQPFTKQGQDAIAGGIINRFAEGGPTTLNNAEIVPGSLPTLAESTGNAGIARLQAGARDVAPNAFVAREKASANARNALFDKVAGDEGKLDFFKGSRASAAQDLYGEALKADVAPNVTPYLKGQITQLLKRPSIDEASRTAQRWAIERGEKPSMSGSLPALHDVKTALDDKIAEAVRAGKGGEAQALGATKDKLLDVMEKLSPAYKEARVTYAEMSKPVNQMEVLQGLKVTDSKGNITLSKIQNAIDGLESKMNAPGANPAKSLTADQVGTLKSIRDDLLRQANLAGGKSAGSNTFQNIATDNILATMLPGKLGNKLSGKVGDAFGQVGKLAYSGPNEKIRNRLADLMLDPVAAQQVMRQAAAPRIPSAGFNALTDAAGNLYRAAPALSSNR